jgi:hypothetical protein
VQPVEELSSRTALHSQARTDRTLMRPCRTTSRTASG